MIKIFLAAVLLIELATISPAYGADISQDPVLQMWWRLDDACRGGDPDSVATKIACDKRSRMRNPFTPQRLRKLKVWCKSQGGIWYVLTQRCMARV